MHHRYNQYTALVNTNGTRAKLYLISHDDASFKLGKKFANCKGPWVEPVNIEMKVNIVNKVNIEMKVNIVNIVMIINIVNKVNIENIVMIVNIVGVLILVKQ